MGAASFSPGLYPVSGRRPGQSRAEEAVYAALRAQLPAGWTAWHSLTIRRENHLLGEGDFIIADPKRGFLVLEVKGGVLSQRDGHWYQYDKRLKQAPRQQAEAFAHSPGRRLVDEGCERPPFGSAVCFPDMAFERQPSQDDLRGVVIGKLEMGYLDRVLPSVMERALPSGRRVHGAGWIRTLHELWGHTWVPHLGLGPRSRRGSSSWWRVRVAHPCRTRWARRSRGCARRA